MSAKIRQDIQALNNIIVREDLQAVYDAFAEKGRLKDSTIVLTGCAGFLGYYLMHFLAAYAEDIGIRKVVGFDNFQLGRPEWIDRLAASRPGVVEVHSFDVTSHAPGGALAASKADYVMHMASIASPAYYRKYPLETLDANVWGLRRLLDFYKNTRLKGFLFFSSSEIYGDPPVDQIPTNEDYRGNVATMGPRACYDEAKRFGETLCYLYAQEHGMPAVIVRPFNNYGPGMRLNDKRVPADFAAAVLENKHIVMHSDGTPTRTFCYITDAVTGYLKALVHGQFGCFNIGMGAPEISMRELAEIYAARGREFCGYTGKAVFEPSPEQDYLKDSPNRRCPDISRAKEKLGFNPSVYIEEGVGRFLRYYLEERIVES